MEGFDSNSSSKIPRSIKTLDHWTELSSNSSLEEGGRHTVNTRKRTREDSQTRKLQEVYSREISGLREKVRKIFWLHIFVDRFL